MSIPFQLEDIRQILFAINSGSSGITSTVNQGTAGIASWLTSDTVTQGRLSTIASLLSGTLTVNGSGSTWPVTGTGSTSVPSTGILTIQGNPSGVPIPISGTIVASNPSVSATGSAFPASATLLGIISGSNLVGVSASNPIPVSIPGTIPVSQSGSWTVTANAGSGTFGVSGTVTANAGSGTFATSSLQLPIALDGSGFLKVHEQGTANVSVQNSTLAVTQSGAWSVTANIGTTNGLALDSSVNGLLLAQSSTSSGQSGPLIQGSVTSSAPTYVNLKTSPLSLTTAGNLRVDGSSVVQPVSGTVTANAGSGTFSISGTVNANQGGSWTVASTQSGTWTNTVTQATGSNLHTVVDSGTVSASQSGTWTIQPGNTPNTSPWLFTLNQGGNSATVTASNALKVDGSTVVQPVSGTLAVTGTFWQATQPVSIASTVSVNTAQVNGSTISTAATGVQKVGIVGSSGATLDAAGQNATSPANALLISGQFNTSPTTITTGNVSPLQLDSAGNLLVNVKIGGGGGTNPAAGLTGSAVPTSASYTGFNSAGNLVGISTSNPLPVAQQGSVAVTGTFFQTTQPISGTVTANAGSGTFAVSGTVTANIGTTNGLALDSSVNGLLLAQASTTSGQKGLLIQGAVTTSAPTYANTQTSPLSLTTAGNLRVDGSSVVQPVSGTITANAGSGTFSVSGTVTANQGGSWTVASTQSGSWTNTVTQATGTNLHTVVDSGTIASTQSGTWTVQPGNTPNTSPWLFTLNQGGNSATVTASNALKVDGSAITQPISGNVGVTGTVAVTESGTWTVQPGNTANTTPWLITVSTALPAGSATIGAVTQASGPWTENITQIAGSAISTAASGIQKVGIVGGTGVILDAAGQNAVSPANWLLMGGQFNTAPTTITSGSGSAFQLDSSGNLKVNVISGGGSNASVGTTGATAPTSATEIGIIVGGNLVGVSASNPLPISGSISATNPSVGTNGAAFPTSSTEVGFISGSNLVGVSSSNPFPVNVISGGGANASVGLTGTTAPTSATEIGWLSGGNLVGVATTSPLPTAAFDGSGNAINSLTAGAGANGLMTALGATNFFGSVNNSSTAQLIAGTTFTGVIESVYAYQAISVLLVSDQSGLLTLNQYIDIAGTRIASSWVYPITAGVGFSRCFVANGNYFNLTFQNMGTATSTTLNINTAYGILPSSTNLGNAPISINEINGTIITPAPAATAATISQPAIVTAFSPNSQLPSGSATIGNIGLVDGGPNNNIAGEILREQRRTNMLLILILQAVDGDGRRPNISINDIDKMIDGNDS